MKKVVVIFGSISSEHEVSCKSAYSILTNIDKQKYDVSMIGIDKQGKWFEYVGNVDNVGKNTWIEDYENKKKIEDINEHLKKYDVAFPVLHGKYGEDGTIQLILEKANIKYVGCDVLASKIAMDKIRSKEIVKETGISIVGYVSITKEKFSSIVKNKEKFREFIENLIEKLSLPIFVKPNQEGSSYGVSKVEQKEQIKEAIQNSFKYDDCVLIEKYISNRKEIECAIIEKDNDIYASTPGEIVSANEIYDYDSKYNNDNSYTKIPADISSDKINIIKEYAKKVFKVLNLSSLSRIDFFVSNEKIYFNEVNTMPGFTNISMYPKMLMHDGISYNKIIEILIESSYNK